VLGIPLDNPPLNGLDSLLSTVQMPGGVPVATFGAGPGGPVNAALFAARVLALSDAALAGRVARYSAAQTENVAKKDAALQQKLKR
jgi:5-(carboxyamino)imidazole ribonucleotide mutase